MSTFLTLVIVLSAIVGGLVGIASLTKATMGVGVLAAAILMVAAWRVLQAEIHHDRERKQW